MNSSETAKNPEALASPTDGMRRQKIIRRVSIVAVLLLATGGAAFFIANQQPTIDLHGHSRWWSLLAVPLAIWLGSVYWPVERKQLILRFLLPISLGLLALYLIENLVWLHEVANSLKDWSILPTSRRGGEVLREESLKLLYLKVTLVSSSALLLVISAYYVAKLSQRPLEGFTGGFILFCGTIFCGLFLLRGVEIIVATLLGFLMMLSIVLLAVIGAGIIWLFQGTFSSQIKRFWAWIAGRS